MAELKLDLENTGQLTLDDISFGDPEVITGETPELVPPVETVSTAPAVQTPVLEEPVKLELAKLEDINFGGEVEVENASGTEQTVKPVDEVATEHPALTAARGLLQKKLDRNKLETEIDLTTLNEEQLADFEEELDNTILDNRFQSYASSNKNLKTLMDYIDAKGDPKKISKLFDTQDTVDALNITTEVGQIKAVESYYKNVHNWSDEKISSKIDRLKASGLLEEEATDAKSSYDEHITKQTEAELATQQKKFELEQQREGQRRTIFETSLQASKVPTKLQDELRTVAFGKGLLEGQEVSILDYKVMQMQADPDKFLKLSYFLADPEAYDKAILQYTKNAEVTKELKKGFNFEVKTKQPDNTITEPKINNKIKLKFN